MTKEIWKDIEGFDGLYKVSNFGRVKSLIPSKRRLDNEILRLHTHKGYQYVNLYKNKKAKKSIVHRLVAKAFIKNPEDKPCVNHKDFNRSNNTVSNLEWVTYRENIKHRNQASEFTSKYFGVCWDKSVNRWYAGITHNKKQRLIGYFDTEYEAHLAYESELKKLLSKKESKDIT